MEETKWLKPSDIKREIRLPDIFYGYFLRLIVALSSLGISETERFPPMLREMPISSIIVPRK